jgi:hypothetical protein
MDSTAVQEALAWVNDASAIHLFCQAPHHGHLKSKGSTRFFYDTTPQRGLTDPLRECFWPQEASAAAREAFYKRDPEPPPKVKPAPKVAAGPKPFAHTFFSTAPRPTVALKKKHAPAKAKKSKAHSGGIKALRLGSQVHRQIDQVVKLGVNEFLDKNTSFRPETLAVIMALHDYNPELRILFTEYLAGCPALGIATRIDIICVDKQGRIYIVETKTGSASRHRWSGHNGMMRGALAPYFGNSSHNRAKVQAILGAMLAILGTGLAAGGQVRCLVAHVNGGLAKLELVPDAVVATVGPIAYAALLAHQRKYKSKHIKQESGVKKATKATKWVKRNNSLFN